MHKINSDHPPIRNHFNTESLNGNHLNGQSYCRESYDRYIPGITKPEIVDVIKQNRPLTIPGHKLESHLDSTTGLSKKELEERRNYRGLIAGAVISLALVIGDYVHALRESEPAEQNPVAESDYHYDSENDYYYRLND